MKKRITSLMLILVVAVSMTMGASAASYIPDDVTYQNLNGQQLAIKIYTLLPDQDPSDLYEDDFEYDGFLYSMSDIVKEEQRYQEENAHTEVVTVTTASKNLEDILVELKPTIEYDDGVSSGTLSLDHSTLKTEAAGYHRINEKRQGVNTMNLKEAFRFQNKLQSMMTDAQSILGNNGNITKVQNTYLRHKVMAEAEDEVTMEAPSTEYSENITEMAEFLLFLLDEREKLSAAIHKAKVSLPLGAGLDGEVSLNGKRQEIATLLRHMAGLRNGEVLISNGGVGYRFNNEGNQVSYRCDVKRVTTINFDRNKIRKMCADLSKKSDETSAALDAALVNTPVEYEAPFDVNETFAEAFEAHMSALS